MIELATLPYSAPRRVFCFFIFIIIFLTTSNRGGFFVQSFFFIIFVKVINKIYELPRRYIFRRSENILKSR